MSDKNKSEKHHECATVSNGQLANTCTDCLEREYDSRALLGPAVHRNTCGVFSDLGCTCDPLFIPFNNSNPNMN